MSDILINPDVDDFLAHYGILGMKWGKRKDRGSDGKVSKATDKTDGSKAKSSEKRYFGLTKKQAIIGGSIVVGTALIGTALAVYGKEPIKMLTTKQVGQRVGFKEYQKRMGARQDKWFDNLENVSDLKMSDLDVKIPAGSTLRRISDVAENTVRDNTYAAFKPEDVNRYRSVFTKAGGKKVFDIEIANSMDLISPSQKKRVSLLGNLADIKMASKEMKKASSLRDKLVKSASDENAAAMYRLANKQFIGESAYKEMVFDGVTRTSIGKAYLKEVKRAGYNALIDDNNAGTISDSPIILLDSAIARVKKARQLNKVDLWVAKKNLVDLLSS